MGVVDPRGILPDALLAKEKRAEAIAWITTAPFGRSIRIGLVRGWGQLNGVLMTAPEYALAKAATVASTPVEVPRSEPKKAGP